jgi:hypothetical protein
VELVNWLDGDYRLSHGHANALVAHVRAMRPVAA